MSVGRSSFVTVHKVPVDAMWLVCDGCITPKKLQSWMPWRDDGDVIECTSCDRAGSMYFRRNLRIAFSDHAN